MTEPTNWRDVKAKARGIDPAWDSNDRVARRQQMRAQMLAAVSGAKLGETCPARPALTAWPVRTAATATTARSVRQARSARGAPTYQPKSHTVFQRSGTGDYSGATVSAEGGEQMSMRYSVACNSYFPFLSLTWDGDGLGDYDYVRVDSGNDMSGTQYLNPSSGSGSFEIRTQDSCNWTITVTQKY